MALINSSISNATDELASSLSRFGPVARVPLGGWDAVSAFLLPLKSFPTRYALIPFPGWTAILGDMRLEICHVDALGVSKRTGARAVSAYFKEQTRQFHLIEGGRSVRDISCYEDEGRWIFLQQGEPASWEQVTAYPRPTVSERLTPDMVLQYLSATTGLAFPMNWRKTVGAVGLERSTKDLKLPIRQWQLEVDL